jgi:hypothetical protein
MEPSIGKFKPASPQQMREIKESVDVAVAELKKISWNVHKPKRGSSFIPTQPRAPDNAKCRKFLNDPTVQKAVGEALHKGDGYFFVRFGRTLSQSFVFIEETKYPLVPVFPFFIVSHWAESKDGLPEFCYISPSDLVLICTEHLGDEAITEDAIVRMRSRLKLKPFRGRKLKAKYVLTKAGTTRPIFPELDK